MKKRKNSSCGKLRHVALLLCLVLYLTLSLTWAFASGRAGSISLSVEDQQNRPAVGLTIVLYRVADLRGSLTAPFSGTGVGAAALLDTRQNAENSKMLANYAAAHSLSGVRMQTDEHGAAVYANLGEGIYLILCAPGQWQAFQPFLVHIPTVIGDQTIYDIKADPKTETVEPWEPSPSPEPSVSPEPTHSPEPTDSPEPGVYTVYYSYEGDVPAAAPPCPEDAHYAAGETVVVAPEPEVPGYSFVWTYDPAELPSSLLAELSADQRDIGVARLSAYRLAARAREDLKADSFVMPANDVHIIGIWKTQTPIPDQPDLPQTGVDRRPVHLLLGVGTLFVLAGGIDLLVNRRKRDE